jgi:high affinity sulfate transporter 1
VILSWIRGYDRSWFRYDLIAGVSVAALVVPKALGYAGIVGVPVEYGLYAAAAGAILYALFGTSRQISTGPSSSLAAVAAGAAVLVGVSGAAALSLVAWITLLAGVLFVLLAILKMGWIAQFLSKAVVKGFLFGAALEVTIGELPKLTGTSAEGSSAWRELGSWVRSLGETDMTTLVLGVSALCLILGLRFSASRFPGALVLVVGGILLTRLLDLQVALVGEVPSGFPSFVAPDLAYLADHLSVITPAAIGILLIGFSQSAGDAREFASRHKYRVDIDRESIAQGVANVGSGLVQGIPVATSLSASSLNDQSGAKTQMSSLVTGAIVVLTMLFLAPLFSDLPKAVLAAVIIDAVLFGMIDLPGMGRLYRVQRFDFWISIAALLGVLTFGVLAGVIIGMVLSIIWLIRSSTHPNILELGNRPGTEQYRDLETHPDDTTFPGLLIIRFDGAAQGLAGARNVEFRCMSFRDLPWQERFDAIVCLAFLHHVSEPELPGFLRACHDHLAPGGLFFSQDPNVRGALRAVGRVAMGKRYHSFHTPDERELDPDELGQQLRTAGFADVAIRHVDLTLTATCFLLRRGWNPLVRLGALVDRAWCASPLARWSSGFAAVARRGS